MSVSKVIANNFQIVGIQHVFGYTGDSLVGVLEACRRNDLQFILTRPKGHQVVNQEALAAE